MTVYSKGFSRTKWDQILYFRTKTPLIDPPLANLGNFNINDSNDVVTIYWIGLDEITLSEKDTIEVQGIAMYVVLYQSEVF